jgi:DNA-binding transcriptional regulator YiaG
MVVERFPLWFSIYNCIRRPDPMVKRSRWQEGWRPIDHDPESVVRAREGTGLSQRKFARALNITSGYLSEIESGKRNANQSMILRIAALSKCPVNYLLAKPSKIA